MMIQTIPTILPILSQKKNSTQINFNDTKLHECVQIQKIIQNVWIFDGGFSLVFRHLVQITR